MRAVVAMTAVVALMGLAQAQADDAKYSCARGENVRTVAVVMQPASGRACEVQYEKTSMGGAPEVLWHADSDTGFCSDQAKTLVGRLSEAGWTCSESEAIGASADPMPEPMAVAVEVAKPSSGEAATGVTAATNPASAPTDAARPRSDFGFRLRPSIH